MPGTGLRSSLSRAHRWREGVRWKLEYHPITYTARLHAVLLSEPRTSTYRCENPSRINSRPAPTWSRIQGVALSRGPRIDEDVHKRMRMLLVPAGLSGEYGGVFVQPAAMTSVLLSRSSRVICDPIDHLASL